MYKTWNDIGQFNIELDRLKLDLKARWNTFMELNFMVILFYILYL